MKKKGKLDDRTMVAMFAADKPISERAFARIVNCDHNVIRRLRDREILVAAGGCQTWLIAYTSYLKGVAAGRSGMGV